MNFSSTLEKIEESEAFKNFKKEHKDAYLCAGFFVLDFESGEETSQQQLDYSLENGKIYTFALNDEITLKESETIEGNKEKLQEISEKIEIDLNKIKEVVEKEMEKQEISNKINKIIAILQIHENKEIWNLNCMLESFGILHVHLDSQDGKILKFEKRSLFEFVKRVK